MNRTVSRQRSERCAGRTLVQLLAIAAIWRTAMTDLMPLVGGGLWWVALLCLLPGLAVTALLSLAMSLARTETLPELARRCLGKWGGWLWCTVLALLLTGEAASALNALVTLFTQGIGTRGTQWTLSLLTGGALLLSLHEEGLPRAAYLLRWVLLAGAVLAAIPGLLAARVDNLFPLDGISAARRGFSAAWSLGWPMALLTLIPADGPRSRWCDAAPVVLGAVAPLIWLCLAIPGEVLAQAPSLAQRLLLPCQYGPQAVQTLYQCLLMLVFFLGIAAALHLGTAALASPLRQAPKYLRYGLLAVVLLLQIPDASLLRGMFLRVSPWLLLPFAALAAVCLPIAVIRRRSP